MAATTRALWGLLQRPPHCRAAACLRAAARPAGRPFLRCRCSAAAAGDGPAAQAAGPDEAASPAPSKDDWAAGRRERQRWLAKQAAQLDPPAALSGVRIVLVSPKSAVNVGAIARLADNFECHDLWVVDPRCDITSPEAVAVSIHSHTLLRARTVATLADALADTSGSIALTRRDGNNRRCVVGLRALFELYPHLGAPPDRSSVLMAAADGAVPGGGQRADADAAAAASGPAGPIAIVLGREESGLRDEEVAACSVACALPTGRLQPSLNLSHATALALATLFEYRCELADAAADARGATRGAGPAGDSSREDAGGAGDEAGPRPGIAAATAAAAAAGGFQRPGRRGWAPATTAELASFLTRMSTALTAAGLDGREATPGEGRRRRPVGHLRAILQRAGVDSQELRALQGLLSDVLEKAGLPK